MFQFLIGKVQRDMKLKMISKMLIWFQFLIGKVQLFMPKNISKANYKRFQFLIGKVQQVKTMSYDEAVAAKGFNSS